MIVPGPQLRGAVVAKYGNMTVFARKMGWDSRRTRRMITGKSSITKKEAEAISDDVGIDNADDFMNLFFPELSIKWTEMESQKSPLTKGDCLTNGNCT